MDKAIMGTMRMGYFRMGVTVTIFDDAIEALEKMPVQRELIAGEWRAGVSIYIFDEVIKKLENLP